MSCNPIHKASAGCKCSPPTKKKSTAAFYFLAAIIGATLLVAFNTIKGYEVQALGSQRIGMVLILGFLTGLHCIGMCGGFMMSYVRYGKEHGMTTFEMHAKYAFAKIISYASFGALFGFLGSLIQIPTNVKSIVSLLGGIFLLYLGAKALGIFSKLKKYSFVKKTTLKTSKLSNPIWVGLLKGLMVSCAPLQALYLVSAGIGNPLKGALLLAVFGIGTLPIFLFYGVFMSTFNKIKTKAADIVTASIIIVFGVLMINRGLNLSGHDFNTMAFFAKAETMPIYLVSELNTTPQLIAMTADKKGWGSKELTYNYGQPIRWEILVSELTMCNKSIEIPALGIKQDLKEGINIITFDPGTHKSLVYTCWMGMLNGKFIVK